MLLISALGTNQILALTPDGELTAVVGPPPSSLPGEGGQANRSPIYNPFGCAVSGDTLLVADGNARFIRKVDLRTGIVTRLAGNGVGGGEITEGMPALEASIASNHVTMDDVGNVYFQSGPQIFKMNPEGRVSAFAGTGVAGNTGDNGPATQARIMAPTNLVYSSSSGALYFSSASRIRRVDRDGIITTVGMGGTSTAEGVPATQALFTASGVAIDPTTETIYVADGPRHRILKFPVGGNIAFLAGVLNSPGFTPEGALARGAKIRQPAGIGVDGRGNIFFSEIGNLLVRWIDSNGILRTVAGTGQGGLITEGVVPTQCDLSMSRNGFMSVDSHGNIYFLEQFQVIRFRPYY
ncbi:MAG: hypothetical protein HY650_14120 [Acidobacteria bacterium]|nr:hypothetical protein [Acidobacteriota bacterium]